MFCSIILSFLPLSVSWTAAIHFDIMLKAYEKTSPIARRFLRHHLGAEFREIAKAAEWADSEDAKTRYPQSEEYHFSHTPYQECSEFDLKRDCGFDGSGRCLVTGISEMVMRAIDIRLSLQDRADAIKFLLHLIADIHQPFHTGFAQDAGGVHIQIDMSPKMSLHQLWDFSLFDYDVNFESPDPSDIQLDKSFETVQDVVKYASLLATESSTLYTCASGYQSEAGIYIVSGETVGADYLQSRSRIANQRIVHAVSRLAHLLDVLGTLFFEKRARLVSSQKGGSSESEKMDDSCNFYAVLQLDFAADEIADISEDALSVYRGAQPAVESASADTVEIPQELSEISILEEAMAHAAHERAALRELSTKKVSSVVAGVELASIVMIKRDGQFVLTRKTLVIENPAYRATFIIPYKVLFAVGKRRRFVEFHLDEALFGFTSISETEFARLLMYLKHGDDVPESAGAAELPSLESAAHEDCVRKVEAQTEPQSMTSRVLGRRVANGRILNPPRMDDQLMHKWIERARVKDALWLRDLKRNADKWKSEADKCDYEFFSKLKSIVMYNGVGNIQGFFHKDTLTDKTKVHRRFNLFLSKNSGTDGFAQFFLIVDTAIYDGLLTPRINKGMDRIASRRSVEARTVIAQANTLVREMTDLNSVLNTGTATKMKIIQDLVQYDSFMDGGLMRVLEWDIKFMEE